ncbi:hypothetical protein C482_19079 [Natrialba chahannaoensis JCM 10990]|uniref:Uncharacterized protein n=1 Tax=Natrialba chahannaoensis JCM 10990 TaxID=1227492 RepID=M0A6N1_9EURY|nr:hypothetical protein [Natrialba chahannaoensis]ELY93532.1 hypothetical protein C482_19079 [Natrialba chahannaoensis JCM 10990]
MRRRSFLAVLAASIVGIGGGYAASKRVAPAGRITRRTVTGVTTDDSGTQRQEDILTEQISEMDPTTVEIRIHQDFHDTLSPDRSNTIDTTLHERFSDRYDDVWYHARHYCDPDSNGNSPCSSPRLSRPDFNDAVIDAEVRMVYRDHPWASVVWVSSQPGDYTVD